MKAAWPKSEAETTPLCETKESNSELLCGEQQSESTTEGKPAKGSNRKQSEGELGATRELDELRRNGFDLSKIEPFVTAKVIGLLLNVDPSIVVRYAAAGEIPGHPLPGADERIHWRFLISEVKESMLTRPIPKKRKSVRNKATRT